ncbi:MAG: hypothetical protein HY756_01015 [Nitrospirae bacterium]|nr:hypothetical protein [Nitrospirota bacterium]
MLKSYFLLNLILIIIIGFLAFEFYNVWSAPVSLIRSAVQKKSGAVSPQAAVTEEKKPDEAAFQAIVQKDIFRPLRTEPKFDEMAKPQVPLIPPKLYGTVITDVEKSAILEDQNTKVTKSYRINDTIGGMLILDIQKDKVILSKEDRTIEVHLREVKIFKAPSPTLPLPQVPPQRPVPQRPMTRQQELQEGQPPRALPQMPSAPSGSPNILPPPIMPADGVEHGKGVL